VSVGQLLALGVNCCTIVESSWGSCVKIQVVLCSDHVQMKRDRPTYISTSFTVRSISTRFVASEFQSAVSEVGL